MATTPTIVDVSTEAQLDAAIAEVNGAAAGSFEIVLQADIAETYVLLNAVNLPSGLTLSISDGAFTLAGPYAPAPAVMIASGSTLTATGTVPAGEMIMFAGTGVTNTILNIAALSQFAGTVEGFASGDELAVNATITAATTGAGSYNSTTNTTSLTLKDAGATVATLALEGDYSGATFGVSSDNVTVTLPSVAPALSSGTTLTGTEQVSSASTTTQTGQITFGSGSDPATVINQGVYDITGAWGIGAGTTNSLLINDGTLGRAANGVDGVSYIAVDVIDTGTLNVPDNTSSGADTNLRFDGANNSFSGIYIGGGMIDYGNPSMPGVGTDYLGNIDMESGACTSSWATVDQNGVITLSSNSTLNVDGGTWNFTSDGAALMSAVSGSSNFANFAVAAGTIAKTGGTGTTVIDVPFQTYGGSGSIVVDTGTLAFDSPSTSGPNYFYNAISGAGVFSLGGGSNDQIDAGTAVATSGWTITGASTVVTLNEALSYSGTFTEESGTTLTLTDSLTLSNAIFDGTVTSSGSAEIVMAGGATLSIEDLVNATQVQSFTAPIGGFGSGHEIILQGFGEFPTINGTSPSYNSGTNTTTLALTYTNDGTISTVATLKLTGGNYSSAAVKPDPNISGAVDLVVCFMPGTMIRTPYGEVAVDMLKPGDAVLSADGRSMPVAWIGRQTVATSFADPLRVLPIRIKASALGDDIPSRDLLLSPDHAVLIDNVLIQAGALVNGVSIVRECDVPKTFTYYHVEIDDHSLIVAENVHAETFIDNVDRLAFDNWQEHQVLYPQGKPITELPYPRAKACRQVPRAIRQKLIERGLVLYQDKAGVAA